MTADPERPQMVEFSDFILIIFVLFGCTKKMVMSSVAIIVRQLIDGEQVLP